VEPRRQRDNMYTVPSKKKLPTKNPRFSKMSFKNKGKIRKFLKSKRTERMWLLSDLPENKCEREFFRLIRSDPSR
jgi:hypothetical protein